MSGIQSIREGLTGNTTRVIVIAIIITFIGSVGWAGFFSQGNANVIAQVGAKQISNVDLNFEISSQQALLDQRFPDERFEEEFLVNFSIDSLIAKFTNLDYLEREGIELTDDFVKKQLSDEDQFLENGVFSQLRFDAFARSNGFIPSDYLERIRQDLLANIWRITLINSSFVTDTEIQESIKLAEQERDISFIRFPLSKFEDSLEYNQENLLDFYSSNADSYFDPEKVKIDYIKLSSGDLEADIILSDDEIEDEYSDYLENFDNTTRKRVSHIMLNINESRDSLEATIALEDVLKRIKNGEEFNSLVTEISEDEGTKDMQGDLGMTDGTLLPPEFELALDSMQEGEVYGPIMLLNSAHLIKLISLTEPSPDSFEQKTESISKELLSRKAEEKYFEVLDNITELSYSLGSVKDISEASSYNYVESGYFTRNSAPEELDNDSIDALLFNESVDGNFSELVEVSPTSFVLFQLKEFVDERQLTFEEIKEELEADYVDSQVKIVSQNYIDELLASLEKDKTLNDISKAEDVSVETYLKLKRDSSLLPGRAINNIFSLPRSMQGNIYGSSQASTGDFILYRLDAVNDTQNVLNEEELLNISNFLNQQKSISEIGELQLTLQNSINIERFN
jgi:peptidyl-prolyl cis-trans isomerase D